MDRKEVISQFNRNKIIEASYQLFLEHDWDRVTVDDIAQQAGFSKATIYAYFKSKNDIFNFIILKCMKIQKEYIEKANLQHKSFKEKYYDLCAATIEFEETYPKCFQVTLNTIDFETEEQSDAVLNQIYKVGEEILEILEHNVARALEAGEISLKLPVKPTVLFLSFSINSLVQITRAKERYIQSSTGYTRTEFLKFSLDNIYKEILKENE